MKVISEGAKEIWKGALQALGAILLVAVGRWLIARIPAIKAWLVAPPGAPGISNLTISLGVLSLALLGLWIGARLSLYRLRKRIARNALTLEDLSGGAANARKIFEKALDKLPH